jgi:hypothetical protein
MALSPDMPRASRHWPIGQCRIRIDPAFLVCFTVLSRPGPGQVRWRQLSGSLPAQFQPGRRRLPPLIRHQLARCLVVHLGVQTACNVVTR